GHTNPVAGYYIKRGWNCKKKAGLSCRDFRNFMSTVIDDNEDAAATLKKPPGATETQRHGGTTGYRLSYI
ncbi:MAG: hypothetical protein JW838_14475, partial [Spirochaetes bacterium]|nr:hypothetical protein [Spirochaetota bacterium]